MTAAGARAPASRTVIGPLLAAALALCAAGCALLPVTTANVAWPGDIAPRAELVQVPFYPQDDYQCGPAALAMALTFAGAPRTPQQLQGEVYLPERKGALQPEMLASARRAGLVAYLLQAPPQTSPQASLQAPQQAPTAALLREVAAGNPVIVLENLGYAIFPQWHYAVVVGYDRDAATLVLRSGRQARLVVRREEFERAWARAGNWAFIAVPPERLPATAEADDFVAAAARLEAGNPQAAAAAYRTALARWPGNLVARIGLGNLAYSGHALAEAEREYRQAAQEHPDSGDAWNNLAQVLHETGRDAEAAAAARRAVALGGARLADYQATLADIAPPSTHAGGAQANPEP